MNRTPIEPSILIIPNEWENKIMSSFHYIELDGSFRGMKPHAFCVAHGIIFNESIPFAISIAPKESFELYELI